LSQVPLDEYWSRICCIDAIKNSLKLKEKNPDTEVYVLYRNIRTYGFAETFYEKAREYDVDEKPRVKAGKKDQSNG
jgi:heterodisulfide reductase subunit A